MYASVYAEVINSLTSQKSLSLISVEFTINSITFELISQGNISSTRLMLWASDSELSGEKDNGRVQNLKLKT